MERHVRHFVLAIFLTCSALLPHPIAAQAAGDGSWRAEAVSAAVGQLESWLEWCIEEKMYAQRDDACALLVQLEPDHERARRILKYERDPRGNWVQRRYKPRDDRSPELVEESLRRRGEAVAPLLESLLERYEQGTVAERRSASAELLSLAPEDEAVRSLLGHVRHPESGAWVQVETPVAEARRSELKLRVAELRGDGVQAREASLTGDEKALQLALAEVSETESVRVLGSVEAEEVAACARDCQTALVLLAEIMGDTRPVPPMVVHLVSHETVDDLLVQRPHLKSRVDYGGERATGTWDPETNELFLWHELPEQRLEEAVEQSLVWALAANHGLSDQHGWAHAGLVMSLSSLVLGESSALRPASRAVLEAAELRQREKQAADGTLPGAWSEAFAAIEAADAPDWDVFLAKAGSSFDDRERFTAAALVRFLLEAHSAKAPEVFRGLAAGRTAQQAFALPAEASFDVLGERMLGWVSEARDDLPLRVQGTVDVSDDEIERLLVAFEDLKRKQREELLEECVEAALGTRARQVALVEEWTRGMDLDLRDLEDPFEPGPFDTRVYKGGDPRREMKPGRSQYDRLLSRIELRRPDPRPWPRRVKYEFATGNLVDGDEIEGERHDLEALLRGELPGQEWAEARLIQELDRSATMRKEADYFAHTYCDRDAFAYLGISLFNAWDAEFEHEMPDPDARAFAIEVAGDDSIPKSFTDADQNAWYPRIAGAFDSLRTHVLTSRAIAHLWFSGRPDLERGYDNSIDLIHATIANAGEDAGRLVALMDAERERFLTESQRRIVALGNDGWNAGNERRDELIEGAAEIRSAVLHVLQDAGL